MAYSKDGSLDHKEIMDEFSMIEDVDREQRSLAVEDLYFVHDEAGQWEESAIQKRRDRPRYTIDLTSPAIAQIVGDQRQNRLGIKVSPQGDSDKKTADIYTGLIRSIEQLSSATNAYDSAFDEGVTCGYGGWRIDIEYADDITFDKDIVIRPIDSACTTLYFSTDAEAYDKRDASSAWLITQMPKKEFQKRFPNANNQDFSQEAYRTWNNGWVKDDSVKLAEYWYKEPVKREIGLFTNGKTYDLKEEKDAIDELATVGVTLKNTRTVETHNVKMVLVSGGEILTEPQNWDGKYIPLIPFYGKTATVSQKKYIRGIVRKSKDAQRIYNYTTSQKIEASALSVKDPFLLTPGQYAGHTKQFKEMGAKNPPVILYNNEEGTPPPHRAGAPQVQTALIQQTDQAKSDIQSTTGIESASLGQNVTLKSGKAIQAEQAMGDRGSYVYQDNLQKSIAYTGIILVDMIPRIYDAERVVMIVKPDDTLEEITINQVDPNQAVRDTGINLDVTDQQTGKTFLLNDISQGRYSVSVKSGPSFAIKRQETVNQLVQLAQGNPVFSELMLDLIIKNMDLNNNEEIESRIRQKMIKEGTVQPTEEEIKEMGLDQQRPDPMQIANQEYLQSQTELTKVQTEKSIAETRNKEADTESKIMQAQKTNVDAYKTLLEAIKLKIDAGVPPTPDELELIEAQAALLAEGQIDVIKGNEIAGSAPVAAMMQQGQPAQQAPMLSPEELAQMAQQGGQ